MTQRVHLSLKHPLIKLTRAKPLNRNSRTISKYSFIRRPTSRRNYNTLLTKIISRDHQIHQPNLHKRLLKQRHLHKLMRPQHITPPTPLILTNNPTPPPLRPHKTPPPQPKPYQQRRRSPKHTSSNNNSQILITQTTTATNRLATKPSVSVKTIRIKFRQTFRNRTG
ncbi:hypothetical protein HanXRQr2_Chr09g0402231 [Helianthus annuus]|uniref:Uncharacterized protein n=1 Tax=Helianthus annuus TaxID=4232 RepID=A0A9K3I7X9_HELAN|nr:hypothetical protein HanXRQr2_Chr09g0402231 [Helianthus annuus]